MSGHARRVPLLLGDGAWPQLELQCHHPLIGAPSPMHANQPWYPTVIFPTTSPAALAAWLGDADAIAAAPRPVPAAAPINTERREMPMTEPLGTDRPGQAGRGAGAVRRPDGARNWG